MEENVQSILHYLATHHPFDQLPTQVLESTAQAIEQRHLPAGEIVLEYGAENDSFFLIRMGAVEVLDGKGKLVAKLGEGDMFGHQSLLGDGTADDTFRTIEETGLYRLSADRFHALHRDHGQFQYFLSPYSPGRLRDNSRYGSGAIGQMTVPVSDIVSREPVVLPPQAKIREAAQLMTRERVSSLMIVEDDQLVGLITDRDLRTRVIAQGLSPDRPLEEILTRMPATINLRELAHDALLAMARNGIHHLPVMDGDRVVGMITDTDLVQRYSTSPVYFVSDIYNCSELSELVKASERLPEILVSLVDANATPNSIGHVISSIGEAINSRLLELWEQNNGAPPVPYAWLTGGSLARNEQTAHSDQDNCLLLSDDYDAAQHGEYFTELAKYVCDGLNDCGYVYCPGEVMAMTPKWRQPIKVWKGYFDHWVDSPEPKALMHTCIFFDLRLIHGDAELFQQLQKYLLDKAFGNKRFHAFMASNALQFEPPLGFFRNFVLVKDGEHDRTLDLKLSGVVPIIDVARVYALANRVAAVNTWERLEAAKSAGALSKKGGSDLIDALDFISAIRLRHQAQQIRNGEKPDNYVYPEKISHLERKHLKDAFSAVRVIQQALGNRYQTGILG